MDAGDLQWFILFKSQWLVVIYYWESVYSIKPAENNSGCW